MKRFIKSLNYALIGIKISFKQPNFRIQISIALITLLLAFLFSIKPVEWCVILLCIGLVLSLEITNSAIEKLVDFVSPDHHKTAGLIKDLAAGAVLVAALFSAAIGIIIFSKYFIVLFSKI